MGAPAWEWAPPCSAVTIDAQGFSARPLASEHYPLADDIDREEARSAVVTQLAGGEARGVGQLSRALAPLSGRDHLRVPA